MRPNLNVAKVELALFFAFAATSYTPCVVAALRGCSIDPVVVFERLCSYVRVSIVFVFYEGCELNTPAFAAQGSRVQCKSQHGFV